MGPGWEKYFGQFNSWHWNSAHVYRQRTMIELIRSVHDLRRSSIW